MRANRDALDAVALKKWASRTKGSTGMGTRDVAKNGTASILVILVNYSDTQLTNGTGYFSNLLFGTSGKTMKTYYSEISQGRFTVSGGPEGKLDANGNPEGIVGPFKVPGTHDSYASAGDKLTRDALAAADNAGIDFSRYDQDGDGKVDCLCIVHQGFGAEDGGEEGKDIHSYRSGLYPNYATKQGTQVQDYFIAPELASSGNIKIGVFCHEFGHILGLPDLYDTDSSSNGIGDYSLMAGGNYGNDDGATPVHMDASCKLQMGWTNLKVVSKTSLNTQIPAVENGNFVIKIPITNSEYYLLENRQAKKFDSPLGSKNGLEILHIDEAAGGNTKEWYLAHRRNGTDYPGLTRTGHYLVALEQADGTFDMESQLTDTGGPGKGQENRGDEGDLYPGSTNNKQFVYKLNAAGTGYASMPPCVKYDDNRGSDPGFDITNISDSAETMTANINFKSDVTPTPVPTPPNNMFTKAQSLSTDGTVTSGSATGTNVGADKEAGEPDHADNAGGASIWYSFSSPAVGTLTIDTKGSAFDTTLAVYTGTSVDKLTLVAASNDADGATTSSVSFSAQRNTTYYIAVDGFNAGDSNGAATGKVKINFSQVVVRPANDDFDRAQTLSAMSTSVTGTNVNATHQSGEPAHATNGGAASVWYRWNCLQSGTATFTTQGSDYDTLLAAYTGNTVSALTAVASNDDYIKGSGYSRISFAAVAGTTYYIAVDGYRTTPLTYASGNIKLTSSVPVIYGIQGNVTILTNGAYRGVANVAVTATRTTDKKTFTAGTSSVGGYAILNLTPGTYTVAVTSSNMKATYVGTATMPITVSNGSPRPSNINFRVQTVTSGKVFNAIALQTVSGVTITATSGDTTAGQAITDSTGSYTLALDPGTYTLTASGTNGTIYSATFTNPVTLGTTSSSTSYNFRALGVTGRTVTLSNQAVSGVKVDVYKSTDSAFATSLGSAVTDSNGFFSIEKLTAGSYTVKPTAPAGRTITPATRTVTITSSPSFSVFNVTVAASSGKSLSKPSAFVLSSASADVQSGTVTLKFTGPLSADDVAELSHYQVAINGNLVSTEAATLSQGAVITLSVDGLSGGSQVDVAWAGIHDIYGGTLGGNASVIAK